MQVQTWHEYRWEFLRRNFDYLKAYQEILILRKQSEHLPPKTKLNKDGNVDPYFSTHAAVKERYFCRKFGLGTLAPIMLDPSMSFEELMRNGSELERATLIGNESWPGVAKVLHQGEHMTPANKILIEVNLDEINSLGEAKKAVCRMIDAQWKSCRAGKPSRRMVDYDFILKVGDDREKGLTNEQIAREIFPRDFKEDNEEANPESAIKKVSNAYQRYRKLVNGGYKDLKFP
jgi:hypothetical protein